MKKEFAARNVPNLRRDAVTAMRVETALNADVLHDLVEHPDDLTFHPADQQHWNLVGSSDMYWISPEMSELCFDAARDLTEVHLAPDLWPSRSGFMVFAEPLLLACGEECGHAHVVHAVAWAPEDNELAVAHFTDVESYAAFELREEGQEVTREAVQDCMDKLRNNFGLRWLVQDGGTSLDPGTVRALPPPDEGADSTTQGAARDATAVLSTVWLLMGQRGVATVTQGVPAAPAHKQMKKGKRRLTPEAQKELNAVRLVEIRAGTDHAAAYTGKTRTHRHRWMVKGHWRRHWYPSLGLHRPTWIAPHMKGPQGAPVLTGDKVSVWRGR